MEDGVTPLFLPYTLAETDTSPLAKKILEALGSEASGGIAPYPDQDEYIERLKVEKLAEINDWRIRQKVSPSISNGTATAGTRMTFPKSGWISR